jgi:hypothetical protein
MTSYQETLIEQLKAKKILGVFNGDFLNCRVAVVSASGKKKIKWQKFSFVFDSSEDCQGSKLIPRSLKGAYSEVYAEQASEIIVNFSNDVGRQPLAHASSQ